MSSELEKASNKLDYKQIAGGGIGSVLIMFLLQEKGLDLVNDKQLAQNQVVIEKTVNNAKRIDKLEQTVAELDRKIEDNFKELREQIRSEISSLRGLLEVSARDRWTRADHTSYSSSVEQRISRLEERVEFLKKISK